MRFEDIPQLTSDGNYRVDVPLNYLEKYIRGLKEDHNVQLNPDFQRGHVWSTEQQIAFVEHILRGGIGSNELRFNCVGWMGSFKGPMVLVDGLQRLTAVRKFMANKIPAFGYYLDEYADRMNSVSCSFSVRVNDLPTREDVLRWYLEINEGGIVHTTEEINKVKALLELEESKHV